jgi:hypothetical protein
MGGLFAPQISQIKPPLFKKVHDKQAQVEIDDLLVEKGEAEPQVVQLVADRGFIKVQELQIQVAGNCGEIASDDRDAGKESVDVGFIGASDDRGAGKESVDFVDTDRVIRVPLVTPSSDRVAPSLPSGNRLRGNPLEKTAILLSFREPIVDRIESLPRITFFNSTNVKFSTTSRITLTRVLATAHLIFILYGALYRFCIPRALVAHKAYVRLRTVHVAY